MNQFSIVLPVRNGGDYVKQCVDSILLQRYPHFQIHILDNCSNDGTTEWITSLKDERIILQKSPQLLSIEESWARIVSVVKNEFMTIIGHDDILHPDFLEVMNGLIGQYPDASLYTTHFQYIDDKGRVIRACQPIPEKQNGAEFLTTILNGKSDIAGTGYVMRSKDYDRLGGIPLYPSLLYADYELWFRLTEISFKASSPIQTFSFRLHQSTTSVSTDTKMQLAFGQVVGFLHSLQNKSAGTDRLIKENAPGFIARQCKGLCHRLLRTALDKRNGITVDSFTRQCKDYADLLAPGNHYDPRNDFTVRLARFIDRKSWTRKLFLSFKKIYPKPVLK